MSNSLAAQRDRIHSQVEALERSLAVSQTELDLLSSDTDEGSEDEEQDEAGQTPSHLLAQRHKIQTDIQNLEDILGSHSSASDSSDESDVGLSPSVDSCLQLNLVYQQVLTETLDNLENLLSQNQRQQRELKAQTSGPIREPREGPASSNQHPSKMFLGSFLKPYFKDRLTGLGPPANQETKMKAQRMMGCPDDKKLRVKRWESWQKTLLIDSVTRDRLKRLMQPKLSRLDFLSKKLSAAQEADRKHLTEQIDNLEKEIQLLRMKKEEELIGDRYEEHDWEKISNIDFEGTKEAEDMRLFWQNFLHPSINKSPWSAQEVEKLSQVCRRHGERDWGRIAEELGTGRTAFMCLQMFQRFVSNSLRRSSWTPEEDKRFLELVERMRIGNFIPYTQISYFMEGRDTAQLIYRWTQVLDPNLRRGPWTKEEDRLLLRAVARHGEKCWWKVRLEVAGRTDGACRDRYIDCLKRSVKKGPFDRHEVELLKELVNKHGVGRWAKIAAEIPHRLDAQCMREWRKLVRRSTLERRRVRKTPPTGGGGGGSKMAPTVGAAKVGIRRRIFKIKKDEEEQMSEDEEEHEEVPYMDSDEDSKKVEEEEQQQQQQQQQEEEDEEPQDEEEYDPPPIEEWIPAGVKQSSTSLNFKWVELPSSSDLPEGTPVRSTVLEKSGLTTIIGLPPRELAWEQRHNPHAVMMVSRDALRLQLTFTRQKCNSAPQAGRRPAPSHREVECDLQAAVAPWIGNLLVPQSRLRTAADALRGRGERSGLSSSSVFLLLLQVENVDTLGCREMIEQRRKVDLLAPPLPPAAVTTAKPKRVSDVLKNKRRQEESQRRLILLQEALEDKREKGPNIQGPKAQGPNIQGPMLQGFPNRFPGSLLVLASSNLAPVVPPSTASVAPAAPRSTQTKTPARKEREESVCRGRSGAESRANLALMGGASTGATGSSADVGGANEDVKTGDDEGGVTLQKEGAVLDSQRSCSPEPDLTSLLRSEAPPQTSFSPASTPQAPPTSAETTLRRGGRKRRRVEAAGPESGLIRAGKRLRRPTLKIKESMEVQAKEKKNRSPASFSKQDTICRSQAPPLAPAPPAAPTTGFCLLPNQSVWVMTPAGPVPLVQAPPPALQVGLLGNAPPLAFKTPPTLVAVGPQPPPVLHTYNFKPFLPTVIQSHDLNLKPLPKRSLPYKGVIKVDPMRPSPPRRVDGHFDSALMFLEPPELVCDWLSGRGGVAIPGAISALPYLPPFVSTLSTLSSLLQAKESLMSSSLRLLRRRETPRCPQQHPDHTNYASNDSDSVSEGMSADEPPDEEEQLKVVRQVVAERFSTNPAYQLLKARFLSFFTVPALLATIKPITSEKPLRPSSQREDNEEEDEEDDEEEFELKKILEIGRKRRAEQRLLLQADESAGSTSHFSGIGSSSGTDPDPFPVPPHRRQETDQC